MKKLVKWAVSMTVLISLFAGVILIASGIIDLNSLPDSLTDNEFVQEISEKIQTINISVKYEKPARSFSAEIETPGYENTIQLPLLILIFGLTVIVAIVNHSLKKE